MRETAGATAGEHMTSDPFIPEMHARMPGTVPALQPLDARIPAWDPATLVPRACPICASVQGAAIARRPDGLLVRLCENCGTYFIDPAPREEELESFYRRYDACHRRAEPIDNIANAARVPTVDPLAELRIRELQSMMRLRRSKVLDVGFGRAEFLLRARSLGATAKGVELDPTAVRLAQALSLDVHLGGVADLAPEVLFDLVTLFDVVEHPLRPMDMLQHAVGLLAGDGLLAIWTPNGAAARRDPERVTFRVDLEHLQYLTTDTCEYLAERLGLRIVHLETLGHPALSGIDKPLRPERAQGAMRRLKRSPVYSAAWKWKERLLRTAGHQASDRQGDYHLFCIMRNGGAKRSGLDRSP